MGYPINLVKILEFYELIWVCVFRIIVILNPLIFIKLTL